MTQPNSTTQALTSSDCDPIFTSGSITLVLDAPRQSIATQALPANFRTLQKIPKISGAATSAVFQISDTTLTWSLTLRL